MPPFATKQGTGDRSPIGETIACRLFHELVVVRLVLFLAFLRFRSIVESLEILQPVELLKLLEVLQPVELFELVEAFEALEPFQAVQVLQSIQPFQRLGQRAPELGKRFLGGAQCLFLGALYLGPDPLQLGERPLRRLARLFLGAIHLGPDTVQLGPCALSFPARFISRALSLRPFQLRACPLSCPAGLLSRTLQLRPDAFQLRQRSLPRAACLLSSSFGLGPDTPPFFAGSLSPTSRRLAGTRLCLLPVAERLCDCPMGLLPSCARLFAGLSHRLPDLPPDLLAQIPPVSVLVPGLILRCGVPVFLVRGACLLLVIC
jgi:hypothetical protein